MKLKRFSKLEFLDLSFNQIEQRGFEMLSKFYIKNPKYAPKELYLRGMTFEKDKHLPLIRDLLKAINSPYFKKLNLKPNNLRKNVKEKFKEELDEKPWLVI